MATFNKPSLARAGTMEITADEGIGFLKSSQKMSLLKFQGLLDDDEDMSIQRNNSITSTVMEAERFLGENKLHADAQTRFQQHQNMIEEEERNASSTLSPKKSKLSKTNTMAATTEEGKQILGKHKIFGATRRDTIRRRATKKATTPSLRTSKTMVRTLEEAKYVLGIGTNVSQRNLTLTPSSRRRKVNSSSLKLKSSVKRLSSMQKTANDGQAYLKRIGF